MARVLRFKPKVTWDGGSDFWPLLDPERRFRVVADLGSDHDHERSVVFVRTRFSLDIDTVLAYVRRIFTRITEGGTFRPFDALNYATSMARVSCELLTKEEATAVHAWVSERPDLFNAVMMQMDSLHNEDFEPWSEDPTYPVEWDLDLAVAGKSFCIVTDA